MAHTKSAGSSKYGRDSRAKYLGVKKFGGERVRTGDILIRQRGTRYLAGDGVKRGGDDTLFAMKPGVVAFATRRKIRFDGSRRFAKVVNVINEPSPSAT